MARGKHGAAAAQRRADASEAALVAERAAAAQKIDELVEEARRLRMENQQLKGALTSKAHEIAAVEIQRLTDAHHAALVNAQTAYETKVAQAFEIISADDAFRINIDLLPRVAEILGVSPATLVPGAVKSRTSRRNLASARKLRAHTDLLRQAREA